MVLAAYGPGIDLHCGGADLLFPHHACETVLAEAATGVAPFARSWLRAGLVQLDGRKMAKSTGNLVLVDDLLRSHPAAAVRLMCLNRPREQAWSFHPALLDDAADVCEQLYAAAAKASSDTVSDELVDALLTGLDVESAVQIALGAGGASARALVGVLALS